MMRVEEHILAILNQTIPGTSRELICAGIRFVRDFLHNEHTFLSRESDDVCAQADYWARHELLVALDTWLTDLIKEGEI